MKVGLFLLLLSGVAMALAPSWVQPGLAVQYDGVSSGIQNGLPVNGVQILITLGVTSVQGNTVSGTANIINPLIDPSIYQLNYNWSCTDGQPCSWRFWVDPANPAGSVKGPNGELFTDGGPVSYTSPLGGPAVTGTNMLFYSNPDTDVEYHLTYQTRTGLIAAYAEIYSSQRTYLYFKSINRDLSGYQPPAQTPTPIVTPAHTATPVATATPVPGAGGACPTGLILVSLIAFVGMTVYAKKNC